MLLCGNAAFSHVVLDQARALAGSNYKAVFRVSHGCEGLPTTGIAVQLPVGVQGAKPMPKAGWALATTVDTLPQPYVSHGKTVTQDVTEIRWTATNQDAALPDAHFDEFTLRVTLPVAAGPLWFGVVQTCGDGQRQGRNAWTQVPASGTSTQGLKTPAALLQVESASGASAAVTPVSGAPSLAAPLPVAPVLAPVPAAHAHH